MFKIFVAKSNKLHNQEVRHSRIISNQAEALITAICIHSDSRIGDENNILEYLHYYLITKQL